MMKRTYVEVQSLDYTIGFYVGALGKNILRSVGIMMGNNLSSSDLWLGTRSCFVDVIDFLR